MEPDHCTKFFNQVTEIAKAIDLKSLDGMVESIKVLKNDNGRIFFLGVGGSAANCSHAVNDFRKLCEIECYCPTDKNLLSPHLW